MGPLLPSDLRSWSDVDFIVYLAGRRLGGPNPEGSTTGVDPFSSNPWDFTDNSWYLLQESTHGWTGDVRRTENGFWRWVSTSLIPTVSCIGWQNTFEFCHGNSSVGTRKGWRMHQYDVGPVLGGDSDVSNSLCRLSWSHTEMLSCSSMDFQILGSDKVNRNEEREALFSRQADKDVLVNSFEDNFFIELNDLTSSGGKTSKVGLSFSSKSRRHANLLYVDFADEDYMELNDMLFSDIATSSSASGMSVNSDINLDEFISDFLRDGSVPVDEEMSDCTSRFTGPVQSDRGDGGELKDDQYSDLFSDGDYLELRDLLPLGTPTNSSNSSCKSS